MNRQRLGDYEQLVESLLDNIFKYNSQQLTANQYMNLYETLITFINYLLFSFGIICAAFLLILCTTLAVESATVTVTLEFTFYIYLFQILDWVLLI